MISPAGNLWGAARACRRRVIFNWASPWAIAFDKRAMNQAYCPLAIMLSYRKV
jgi:hypothetical protein